MIDVDNQMELFRRFVINANKTLNLVSRRSVDKLLPDLISQSLLPISWDACRLASPLLDIGSGAGFPGIPLKIARPELNVTLLDSNRRKVLFLKSAIDRLGLNSIEALWVRVEDFAAIESNRAGYGTVTARAVGNFAAVLTAAADILMPAGEFIVWLSALPSPLPDAGRFFDPPLRLAPLPGLILLNYRRNKLQT